MAITAALFLSGCATPTTQRAALNQKDLLEETLKQQRLTLRLSQKRFQRIDEISTPILVQAGPLCERRMRRRYGFHIHNFFTYSKGFRAAAEAEYGLDERLWIAWITPGLPAQRAGLEVGDILLAINGNKAPVGEKADVRAAKMLGKYARKDSAADLRILRGTEELRVSIPKPKLICNFPVGFVNNNEVNAYADGRQVIVTSGMMRFAASEQELALVVSHELAHNLMRHINAKKTNAAGGLFLDFLFAGFGVNTSGAFYQMGAESYSADFEAEADYVGLYLMARAGVEIEGVGDFWRRMAVENPGSISHSSTHPVTPARYLAIGKAVEEIQGKLARGEPLLPELRK